MAVAALLVVDAQRIGTHAALVACSVLALLAYRRAVRGERKGEVSR